MFNKLKRYSIKDMYVVHVGNLMEQRSVDKFIPHFLTIAYYHNSIYTEDRCYKDIFSDSSYLLFGNRKIQDRQQCCNQPIPILNILREYSSLEEIKEIELRALQTSFMTRKDMIKLYSILNNNHKEEELPKKEPQNTNAPTPSSNPKQTIAKKMNDKVYETEPIIGREEELKQLILVLASQKKSPLLVGPSGVGKTALVEELVYKIQKNLVPKFLKNKSIIELKVSSVVAGTRYRGDFEEKLMQTLEQAKKQDAILFIDEIHTIYGAGASGNSDLDMVEMLKQEIDRENLRVIGTTTEEEYHIYFSQDTLKRRFQLVEVKEPNEELLSKIIDKVFRDYEAQDKISLEPLQDDLSSIISLLIEATRNECRQYNDPTHNPDLIIDMIDMAFANAKVQNQSELTIEDIICGVQGCSRIYDSVVERTIASLKNLKPVTRTLSQKVVSFKN